MRSEQQAVSSVGVRMFPFMPGATGYAAGVRADDNCSTLLLLTPTPELGGGNQSVRDVMEERGRERERGSMCPMTPCGARQMSMFSGQLFLSRTVNQSPAGRRMVTSDSVFFVSGVMLSFLCDSAGRCHGRGGEESFSVRGRGRTAVRFSHALLSAETLLVYVRIPKVSSSYISHGATRRNEKNLALSHVHAVFSQSPPSFFLFFFSSLVFELRKSRDAQEGEGKGRQLQTPNERVGLVTAERGIVPLV